MADNFTLEIATPDRLVFSDDVEMVTAPGSEGEFGVLAGHTDFLTTLKAGELIYKKGSSEERMVVSSGYSQVSPEKTIILVEAAIPVSEIDAAAASSELREATDALAALDDDAPGRRAAQARLDLAEAIVTAKEGGKGH